MCGNARGTTTRKLLRGLVGPARFELATSCTPNRTRRRHQATYFQSLTAQRVVRDLLSPAESYCTCWLLPLQNYLQCGYVYQILCTSRTHRGSGLRCGRFLRRHNLSARVYIWYAMNEVLTSFTSALSRLPPAPATWRSSALGRVVNLKRVLCLETQRRM